MKLSIYQIYKNLEGAIVCKCQVWSVNFQFDDNSINGSRGALYCPMFTGATENSYKCCANSCHATQD